MYPLTRSLKYAHSGQEPFRKAASSIGKNTRARSTDHIELEQPPKEQILIGIAFKTCRLPLRYKYYWHGRKRSMLTHLKQALM